MVSNELRPNPDEDVGVQEDGTSEDGSPLDNCNLRSDRSHFIAQESLAKMPTNWSIA